jgi:pyruvate kinase
MLRYIYTLGPATTSVDLISTFLESAESFRLNSSHLNEYELDLWLRKIDKVFQRKNKAIPVIIDLQGGKMRIGDYPSVDTVPKEIILKYASSTDDKSIIPVPHEEFFQTVEVGDIVLLNDAKMKLKVMAVGVQAIEAVVIVNGPLSSNKGVNITTHPVKFRNFTLKDENIIKTALRYNFTQFAFSFLSDGNEADKIRPLIAGRKLIAKIERVDAFEYLNNIDDKFDEIWLCRGDLGAQAGIHNLGMLQNVFIKKIPQLKNKCFLAGQVLEHMTNFKMPTRSEIVHLYDSEKNGFAGIVLSDETAVGEFPLSVVEFLVSYRI